MRSVFPNATVLVSASVEVAGAKIWGSPVTPLAGAGFGVSSATDRRRLYSTIRGETDIHDLRASELEMVSP